MPIKSLSRRSTPPYNTGKVRIGLLHIPSQPPGRESSTLQSALLPPPLAAWPSDRSTLATLATLATLTIRLAAFLRSLYVAR